MDALEHIHAKNPLELAHKLALYAALKGLRVAILDAGDCFRPHLFPRLPRVSRRTKEEANRRLYVCRIFTPEQLKAALTSLSALGPELALVLGPGRLLMDAPKRLDVFAFPVVIVEKNTLILNRASREAFYGKERFTPEPSDRQGRGALKRFPARSPQGR